jgi:hypothetical protein
MSRALPIWGYFAFLLLFLLATNRWMGWEESLRYLYLFDVAESYEPISRAAPALPSDLIPFHKAQRFAFPWLLGAVSDVLGLDYRVLYGALTFLLTALILGLAYCIVSVFVPSSLALVLFLPCFLASPYLFRYYWIAWGMANDLLYVAGSALIIWAALKGRAFALLLGVLVATTGRQTALTLMPGLALLLVLGGSWRNKSVYWRICVWGMASGLGFVVYSVSGAIAAQFADTNNNLSTIAGIFKPLLAGEIGVSALGEHLLRCTIPVLPLLCALAWERIRLWPVETWALLLMAAAVVAQPFLAGPFTTGRNAGRLGALALVPLLGAVASSWNCLKRHEGIRFSGEIKFVYLLLPFMSLHHMYSWVGPPSAAWFLFSQISLSLFFGFLLFRERRAEVCR